MVSGHKHAACICLQDSRLVKGVTFKKAFSYAGFEMQPKRYDNARVCLLNIELELKAERTNAEVRISKVADYEQARKRREQI